MSTANPNNTPEHMPLEADPTVHGRTRAVRQLPEAGRFWIAYAPRTWRCADKPWTDLGNGRLEGYQARGVHALPEIEAGDLDDLFYLPPVATAYAGQREQLAAALIESGTPVLLQMSPGEELRIPGVRPIYDLLAPLLDGDIDRFGELPAGSTAVWPLIAGLTDLAETWDEGCAILAAVGVRCVQPLTVEITPAVRRRLTEGREEHVFDALFHGKPPSERAFARSADRHGLGVFMPREPTGISPRQIHNRQIAAELALAAELWLRLRKSIGSGQSFFRAARGAESTHHDLTALVREKNLTVMDWLDKKSVDMVQEIVEKGRSSLVESLLAEYLGRKVRKKKRRSPPPDTLPDD